MSALQGPPGRIHRIRHYRLSWPVAPIALLALVWVLVFALASAQANTGATFGFESFGFEPLTLSSLPFPQAGGHPYALTTTIALNSAPVSTYRSPAGNPKDIIVKLPPGLVGNPTAVPQCTRFESERFQCTAAEQIGIMKITIAETEHLGKNEIFVSPLYNLVPSEGNAAAFG